MTTMFQGYGVDSGNFSPNRTQLDNCRIAAQLAEHSVWDTHIIYEDVDKVYFVGGVVVEGSLTADHAQAHVVATGETQNIPSTGRINQDLDALIQNMRRYGSHFFGWVNFEYCLAARGHNVHKKELAHFILPEVIITLGEKNWQIQSENVHLLKQFSDITNTIIGEGLYKNRSVDHLGSGIDVRQDSTNYTGRVQQAVDEIQAEQYHKVILSRTIDLSQRVDFNKTYIQGREANTPVRSFLVSTPQLKAAGYSPEIVAHVNEQRKVYTEPLAGTRQFGLGKDSDEKLRRELTHDPKEIHEHAISVRGSIEDLVPITAAKSIHVDDFMTIRERNSVQHLGSTVVGTLSESSTPADALHALFPAVTASGLPKEQAIDAIARLDEPRDLYSGAVVSIKENTIDAALVLRAIYQTPERTWLRAGAGIVSQSKPEREFEETCEKLSSVAPYVVFE